MTQKDNTILVPRDIVSVVKQSYLTAPDRTTETLKIAIAKATTDYIDSLRQRGFSEKDIQRIDAAVESGRGIVTQTLEVIQEQVLQPGETVTEENLSGKVLYAIAAQMASGLRLNRFTINSHEAQTIIASAFNTVADIADLSSTDFYIGTKAKDEKANKLIKEFFETHSFEQSVQGMRSYVHPADLILDDWGATVQYCIKQGIEKQAFLPDGTNLFKFSPDALPYAHSNPKMFPNLEINKVNNGQYVDSWLTGGDLGDVTLDNWLVLLTGYTPEDNKGVPGLYERYPAALVSTALDIHNRRF
jgi:hypothetical protein